MIKIWMSIILLFVDGYLQEDIYEKQKNNPWYNDGINLIKDNLKSENINKKAKGVILFVGDGMSITTVTAARIFDGQKNGLKGEENVLSWERFKNVAFSKTYNVDMQVADSAGTATAFMTGVKANTGVVSVNENVTRGNCSLSKTNHVMSILEMAEEAGLSTGVVTTARLTHATPATAYAHSADRNWENDDDVDDGDCSDIASQLIDFPYGDGLEVAFGGGRRNFMKNTTRDPEYQNSFGKRKDGRSLVTEWSMKTTANSKFDYIWRKNEFDMLNPAKVDHVLGLFEPSHMNYEYDRINDIAGEPSLTEMVEFAINVLQKNPKGYFLLVESGRIDHGHHGNRAYQALSETAELAKAVGIAKNITDPNETLLIVTADHSHVFTMGGYQERGTSIFGLTNKKRYIAKDKKRFPTLGYMNGPGAKINETRTEPNPDDLKDPKWVWESWIPLSSETHGGDDVGIHAHGCQSHLIRGVVEQNYIFHVMDYALCLSKDKQQICEKEGLLHGKSNSSAQDQHRCFLLLIIIVLFSFFN